MAPRITPRSLRLSGELLLGYARQMDEEAEKGVVMPPEFVRGRSASLHQVAAELFAVAEEMSKWKAPSLWDQIRLWFWPY